MNNLVNITRSDIAEAIHNEFGLSKKDCIEIVSDIVDIIVEGLIKNENVKIHNFGTFKLRQKNSRIGRNPKTKEEYIIQARKVISFKPSKNVLRYINSKNINVSE
tara:strand:+ start:4827 stop:5141 length:315 start_codon:yes stop_codon:yes gene_type:complete